MWLALKPLLLPVLVAQAADAPQRTPALQEPCDPCESPVMSADARRHDGAMAHWAASRRRVHTLIAIQPASAAVASDVFHPVEPVYRA
jgi:hypothetical protein